MSACLCTQAQSHLLQYIYCVSQFSVTHTRTHARTHTHTHTYTHWSISREAHCNWIDMLTYSYIEWELWNVFMFADEHVRQICSSNVGELGLKTLYAAHTRLSIQSESAWEVRVQYIYKITLLENWLNPHFCGLQLSLFSRLAAKKTAIWGDVKEEICWTISLRSFRFERTW